MSDLYPVFVDINRRKVVVIGGGAVAERKVEVLLAAAGQVTVISPAVTERLGELVAQGKIDLEKRGYRRGDLAGAWLVVAAAGVAEVNQQVFAEANERHIFCNVVDEPELCSFQVPSVVRRGDLQLAISTGGISPALAKRLRRQLEKEFGEYYEVFLAALAQLRAHVQSKFGDDQPRRAEILEGFVNSEAIDLLRQDKLDEFQCLLAQWRSR